MAKRPFTLEAWLKDKSQRVETRDGRPVKIISFEMTDTNDCPIAAQFRLCAGTPVVYLFDKEGRYKGEGDSDYDLFLVTPEEELTEFEKAFLERVFHQKAEDLDEENREIFREDARCVLELARKQLQQEIRAEALKDLPKWRKAAGYSFVGKSIMYDEHGFYCADITKPGCRYITCDVLAKLPGLNE